MMSNDDKRFGPQDIPHTDSAGPGADPHVGLEPERSAGLPVQNHGGHGGHKWMMIACCVPMLVIAIALVASGTASAGALVIAIGCTLMMVLMMRGMGGHGGGGDQ